MSSEKLRLWDSTVPIVGRLFRQGHTFETTFTIAKPLVSEKLGGMSFLKTLFADVRSNFVGLIMAAVIAIFSPMFASIWKRYSKEDVPWTIFVIVSCVGIVLLFIAIRLTKKFPVLTAEKLGELQERNQQALIEQAPSPRREPRETLKPKDRNFITNEGLHNLISARKDRTALQRANLLEPFKGQWIKVEGKLIYLGSVFDGGSVAVIQKQPEGDAIGCQFSKAWVQRLSDFSLGDDFKATGQIALHQSGDQLFLVECELPD